MPDAYLTCKFDVMVPVKQTKCKGLINRKPDNSKFMTTITKGLSLKYLKKKKLKILRLSRYLPFKLTGNVLFKGDQNTDSSAVSTGSFFGQLSQLWLVNPITFLIGLGNVFAQNYAAVY